MAEQERESGDPIAEYSKVLPAIYRQLRAPVRGPNVPSGLRNRELDPGSGSRGYAARSGTFSEQDEFAIRAETRDAAIALLVVIAKDVNDDDRKVVLRSIAALETAAEPQAKQWADALIEQLQAAHAVALLVRARAGFEAGGDGKVPLGRAKQDEISERRAKVRAEWESGNHDKTAIAAKVGYSRRQVGRDLQAMGLDKS